VGPCDVPTLVVVGAKSPAVLRRGSRALAEALSNAELRELEGVSHRVKMNVLAPVVADLLAGAGDRPKIDEQFNELS
jgi:pimeloyl-ACP methyl ester carboxylesterase